MCLHYLESPSGHTEKPISHCYTFCFTFQTCFRKLKKRRKVYNMHLPIFLLSCSSLFLCQDSFNYHFLSISRNSVSHSFMVGRLATHPLSFPLPDTLLISPSFWRIVVLDTELWADSPFPWAFEKCVTFFFGQHCFWWEIHCHSNCFSHIGKQSFCCFQDFFFFL